MTDSLTQKNTDVLTVSVYSAGKLIPADTQLIRVETFHSENQIPSAKLIICDGDITQGTFPVSDSDVFTPGASIQIDVGAGSDITTIFKGVVIKHGVRIESNDSTFLELECQDPAVAMSVGHKNANFIEMTDSEIFEKLIEAYPALSADIEKTANRFNEIVQFNTSDWDFMLARAKRQGFILLVDAGRISIKTPAISATPSLTLTWGDDLLNFNAELDARTQFKTVKCVAWDAANRSTTEQIALSSPLNSQGNINSATLADVIGLPSYRLQSTSGSDYSNLKSWADAIQERSGLTRISGSMSFKGNAAAQAGGLIEVKGVGKRFSGNAYINSVHHTISGGNWITEVTFGTAAIRDVKQNSIDDALVTGINAGVSGLHIGVVKKLDADPSGNYRIQVSIPVMQTQPDGIWARLATSYGSDGIGTFFIPEIGDEVILGFFDNDPSCPVILGSLYSKKQPPPYEISADNCTKAIITRSKLKVEFDENKKTIKIATPGNNRIILSDDEKSILLQDQNSNQFKLSPDGIMIDSISDITLNAKGKVSITAIANIDITSHSDVKTAGLNVSNNANISFVAKGSASAELSASGQTTIKGAMVMIN